MLAEKKINDTEYVLKFFAKEELFEGITNELSLKNIDWPLKTSIRKISSNVNHFYNVIRMGYVHGRHSKSRDRIYTKREKSI